MSRFTFFRSNRIVPPGHRHNFWHLYQDIAWYGVLAGSAQAFVAIYAAHQGADALQVGLLNAGPALISLLVTLPAGRTMENLPLSKYVFWGSIVQRFGYLLWAFLPFIFPAKVDVWALILLTLLMSIPGTGVSVGFNALFAACVPPEWRGYVTGIRNALIAVTQIITTLICGAILQYLPFPWNYQLVFLLGFLGGIVGSYHLWKLRPPAAAPSTTARPVAPRKPGFLRLDILKSPFGAVLGVLFLFHLTQYLPAPLFPLYQVNVIKLTDQEISMGTAIFNFLVFLGSMQLDRISQRFGHHLLTGIGAAMMAVYPILLAFSQNSIHFLLVSVMGGASWAIVGGALPNYLLDQVPDHDRPAHLAWYNLALNSAILIASLVGPFSANRIGLVNVLFLAAGCRLFSAIAILTWGKIKNAKILTPESE